MIVDLGDGFVSLVPVERAEILKLFCRCPTELEYLLVVDVRRTFLIGVAYLGVFHAKLAHNVFRGGCHSAVKKAIGTG